MRSVRERFVPTILMIGLGLMLARAACATSCPPDHLFGTPVTFPTYPSPQGMALADLDGDGIEDLAIGISDVSFASVLFGRSNASADFEPPVQISIGYPALSITSGDFNGDGILDLAASNGRDPDGAVSVVMGTGVGGHSAARFTNNEGYQIPGHPTRLRVADLNHDGFDDIILLRDSSVGVLMATGNPTPGFRFSAPQFYSVPSVPTGLTLADINGDGTLDAVVVNYPNSSNASVTLLTGRIQAGVFDFCCTTNRLMITLDPLVSDPIVADFNGDGKLDVLAPSQAYAFVFLGDQVGGTPAGTFAAPWAVPLSGSNGYVGAPVAADFNGDSELDTAIPVTGGISVLIGRGNGDFEATNLPINGPQTSLVSYDFNHDGRTDLAGVRGGTAAEVWVLSGMCPPTVYSPPAIFSVGDVPFDQGGRVKVSWNRAGADSPSVGLVDRYWLWRSVPNRSALLALKVGKGTLLGSRPPSTTARLYLRTRSAQTDYYWEFVDSLPAAGLGGYSYVATTTSDSIGTGSPLTSFFVQARGSNGAYRSDSAPDSGYSVDNLSPRTPAEIGGHYAPPSTVTIHWSPSRDSDLSHYSVYAGNSRDFALDVSRRFASTTDTTARTFTFSKSTYFKVTAVDIHGNESDPAVLAPEQVSGVGEGVPTAAYLAPNRPNPFNPETTIEFGLPQAGRVALRIYTVNGRLVRTLLDEDRPAGTQIARWDGKDDRSAALPSGIYVARLASHRSVRSIKLVLAR